MPETAFPPLASRPTGPAPVRAAIAGAAQRTGVDFGFLMAQAQVESALDPDARASTSSAAGLFQFTRQTWLETLHRHGAAHGLGWASAAISTEGGRARIADPALADAVMDLRFDPEAASLMAGELAGDNARYLEAALGRGVDHVELYLAHFLGAEGARQFIARHAGDPQASAAALFPEAAGANRPVFFDNGRARSLDEVRTLFADKLARHGGDAGSDAAPGSAFAAFAGRGLAAPALTSAAPATAPRRASMAEVLEQTLGAGEAGAGGLAPTHVARAYARLARFNL